MGAKESKVVNDVPETQPEDVLRLSDYYLPELPELMEPVYENENALTLVSNISTQVSSILSPPKDDELTSELSPRPLDYEDKIEISSRIQNSILERTLKYIDKISECIEPIIPSYKYDKSFISPLIEIFSFCDSSTQNKIKSSCKYFSKITDVSRKVIDIRIRPGWLNILKNSIFIESLTLRGEISSNDLHTLTTLIRIEGYPFLTNIKFTGVNDVAVVDILRAIESRFSRIKPRLLYSNPSNSHSAVIHSKRSPSPAIKTVSTYSVMPRMIHFTSPTPRPMATSKNSIHTVSSTGSLSMMTSNTCVSQPLHEYTSVVTNTQEKQSSSTNNNQVILQDHNPHYESTQTSSHTPTITQSSPSVTPPLTYEVSSSVPSYSNSILPTVKQIHIQNEDHDEKHTITHNFLSNSAGCIHPTTKTSGFASNTIITNNLPVSSDTNTPIDYEDEGLNIDRSLPNSMSSSIPILQNQYQTANTPVSVMNVQKEENLYMNTKINPIVISKVPVTSQSKPSLPLTSPIMKPIYFSPTPDQNLYTSTSCKNSMPPLPSINSSTALDLLSLASPKYPTSSTSTDPYYQHNNTLGSPPPILSLDCTYQPVSITIKISTIGSLLPTVFDDLLKRSLHKYLKKLILITQDKEGIETFMKHVSFLGCEVLEDLIFDDCYLGRRSWDYLTRSLWPESVPISLYPPLKRLSLTNTGLVDGCSFVFAQAMSKNALTNLETLDLSQTLFTNTGFGVIVDELVNFACPNLKLLNISNMALTHNGVKALFEGMTNGIFPLLEHIMMSTIHMGEKDIVALSDYLLSDFAKSLCYIDISNNPDVINSLSYIFDSLSMHTFPKLTSLFMDSLGISNTDMICINKWLTSNMCPALTTLGLKGNNIETEGFLDLLVSIVKQNSPNITTIYLSNNRIGSKNINTFNFSDEYKVLRLSKLELSYNLLNDIDIKQLSYFLDIYCTFEDLTSINLDNNNFCGDGLTVLNNCIRKKNIGCIRKIDLSNNRLHDSGLAIVNLITSPIIYQLDTLSLCECDFSENDFVYLLKAFGTGICSHLQVLKMNGNHRFTTQCLKLMLYLWKQNPHMFMNLLSISLCYTSVTESGALLFGEFLRSTPVKLKILDMDHINMESSRRKQVKQMIKSMWNGYVYI